MIQRHGSGHVSWVVDLELRPGALQAFLVLTTEMVAATLHEPGALIYERYSDASAAIRHLEAFASRFGERFAALVHRRSFTVFGAVTDDLRDHLSPLGATFSTYLVGFARSFTPSRRTHAQRSKGAHRKS